MQITINAQDLTDGLNIVGRAIAARPPKQIMEGILIEAMNDEVILSATDGSLAIECTIMASITEPGRTVLPGKLFAEMIRKLPGGTVSIRVKDNFAATITCDKARYNLSGIDPVEFPEMPVIEGGTSFSFSQKTFRSMISHVAFAAAVDETRQILTGVLLDMTREEARMVALDGYRLAMQKVEQQFDLPEGRDQLKAIIPSRVMNELSRILPDEDTPFQLTFDRSRMQVAFGNTVLSTVLLAGEYIDYRKIIPTAFRSEAKIDRSSVQNAIDRASLMAREGKNNLIRMKFAPDSLTITSNAEMGDAMEEIDAVLNGDPLEIAFNAKYITDVIRSIDDKELFVHLNSSISPCVFTPETGDDFVYLILPVRIFQ